MSHQWHFIASCWGNHCYLWMPVFLPCLYDGPGGKLCWLQIHQLLSAGLSPLFREAQSQFTMRIYTLLYNTTASVLKFSVKCLSFMPSKGAWSTWHLQAIKMWNDFNKQTVVEIISFSFCWYDVRGFFLASFEALISGVVLSNCIILLFCPPPLHNVLCKKNQKKQALLRQ